MINEQQPQEHCELRCSDIVPADFTVRLIHDAPHGDQILKVCESCYSFLVQKIEFDGDSSPIREIEVSAP